MEGEFLQVEFHRLSQFNAGLLFLLHRLPVLNVGSGVNDNIPNLNTLENAQRHINACFAKSPDLSVKIRHPMHILFINGKNNITGHDSGLFRGTA
jgi:hypothetical protein